MEVLRIPVTKTVIEKIQTPAKLLHDCDGPDLDRLVTTGDLEGIAIEALSALDTCSEDKKKIREWQAKELGGV